MVTRTLNKDARLSEKDKRMIDDAKKMPIVFDDDCPELTPDMESAFIAERKKKPYVGEPVTIYIMPDTLKKAKEISNDYTAWFSSLIDKAVKELTMAK